ncbi:Retrovirus-related Pol polyprotein from type-1 retrotransposable element R1 [Araneus ventricosus]|uniref:Retrovirus-related Pol polyprotein from type-1 retrotransposable element R1 n=1 Tax=Araneus ventricosus TaxID=182803 RepID=A0A4Y2NDK8_ARAVE|nr:Retrovirus-related Pol polyprotein from type-1 retrotransposable element R1 [Araneus ventricosus]
MKVFSSNNVVAITAVIQDRKTPIASVYCPPSEDLEDTLSELEECLCYPNEGVIIMGDFNAKHPVWGGNTEDDRGILLMEFALAKGLAVLNNQDSPPTFDGSTGRSWVDVTLADPATASNVFKWEVDAEPTCSDHRSISFSLYASKHSIYKPNRFRLQNLDPMALKRALKDHFHDLLPQEDNLEKEAENCINKILEACKSSKPAKQPLQKKQRWWSKNLEILRSKVLFAQRKLYQAKDERDRKFLRQRFKEIESIYKLQLNSAKREDWLDICENVTTDDPFGVHFEVAKNPDARFFQLSAITKPDGTTTTSTKETIEELLNFHFPEDQGNDSPSQEQIRRTCRIPPLSSEDLPFSDPEIDAAFYNLKSKKAPGPDGIYGDIVKEAYASNQSYFRSFLNSCLAKGYFPRRWREAQVVMFNKKNKQETSAYHPICLLDAMGKVLDKLITQRVLFHLLSNNLIHPNQFGFLPGRSAPNAIIQLKTWIAEARQEGKHSVIISLDVKSAFSRKSLPQIRCTSISKEYTNGCPQGSNSGPLYWLLIANGALQTEFEEDVRLLAYADDFYLFVKATGKHTIQAKATRALEQLDLWSKRVKISFAHEKTRLIPFGKKGKYKHPPYCRFAGKPIKLDRNLKILGVILDDGLNGIPHIKQTGNKVLQILNRLTIAKYQRGLSGRVVKLLYKRALERILGYAAPSWWTESQAQRQKISSDKRSWPSQERFVQHQQ